MDSVEKEIEKLLTKFNDLDGQTAQNVQECLLQLQQIKQDLIASKNQCSGCRKMPHLILSRMLYLSKENKISQI